jgi:hypothetical protein
VAAESSLAKLQEEVEDLRITREGESDYHQTPLGPQTVVTQLLPCSPLIVLNDAMKAERRARADVRRLDRKASIRCSSLDSPSHPSMLEQDAAQEACKIAELLSEVEQLRAKDAAQTSGQSAARLWLITDAHGSPHRLLVCCCRRAVARDGRACRRAGTV